MGNLFDLGDYADILLRGVVLVFQTLIFGGVAFRLLVLRSPQSKTGWFTIRLAASALIITETVRLASRTAMLASTTGAEVSSIFHAEFLRSGAVTIVATVGLLLGSLWLSDRVRDAILIPPSFAIVAGVVLTSHAAGRLADRSLLLLLTFIHLSAVGCWIGGLPYLRMSLGSNVDPARATAIAKRFSSLARICAVVVVAAGAAMTYFYVRPIESIIGTGYGLVLLSKIVLLTLVLGLGGLTRRLLRLLPAATTALQRVRILLEAETGIGLTIIVAAATLGAQAPSSDTPMDRLSPAQIVAYTAPRWPRLSAPAPVATHADMTVWSEFDHRWAGVIVALMAVAALVRQATGARWARHWPVALLFLISFLFVSALMQRRNYGLHWAPEEYPEFLQHAVLWFVAISFGLFEWGLQTGMVSWPSAALVFPLASALGGALLLTHFHPQEGNVAEFLMRLTHCSIAICSIAAASSRWLEIRLALPARSFVGCAWPVCFLVFGLILLNYREG